MKTEIKKIAVIGAGAMGNGIALVCAHAGYQVKIRDVEDHILKRAIDSIKRSLWTLVRTGVTTQQKAETTLTRIKGTLDLAETLRDADFVIESVPEILTLKIQVFRELDELCKKHVILTTNTSSFSISEIAAATNRPDRVIGTHWVNPPYILPLVEIVRGTDTSDKTLATTKCLMMNLGRIPIVCEDTPGFVINRMQSALFVEMISMVEEGIVTMEDLNKVWKMHLAPRFSIIGPFKLMDSFGLDTLLNVLLYIHGKLEDDKFRPPSLLEKKVKAKELGFKTGVGFYHYSEDDLDTIIKERDERLTWLFRALKII